MGDEAAPDDIAHHVVPPATINRSTSSSSTMNGSDKGGIDFIPPEERVTSHPFSRTHTTMEVADYFSGPRNTDKHSKWPVFLRLHGSIMPKMIMPLTFVAIWSTAIRCISQWVHHLGVNTVLLTVLGFVVGLGLSFRSSTAYERYSEGRKYWSSVMLASQNLARIIWIHSKERPDQGKDDLLAKIAGLNLIVAFSVALKRSLRFEPYLDDELRGYIGHLPTFALEASTADAPTTSTPGLLKSVGQHLGVSFAESNPMKILKKSDKPLGNLPLEILSYLATFVDELVENGQLKVPIHQTLAYNNIASLNDALTGTERILHTPLPVAYSIAISQITWVYIAVLPFQLETVLKWVMIPAAIIASYIILGILLIGREIENPFGYDVNDLPLDMFCLQIAADIDTISSRKKPSISEFISNPNNKIMFPLSNAGYAAWGQRTDRVIRDELRNKAVMSLRAKTPKKHKIGPVKRIKARAAAKEQV